MTLYDPTRTPPYPSADSDLSPTEIARAEEFNLWCAIHGRPFHLGRHTWADGRIEWGVEVDPGKPTGTLAYGTGQIDERQAVVAAFAFLAGLEWADAARRAAEPESDEMDEDYGDDEEGNEDVEETSAVSAEPAAPSISIAEPPVAPRRPAAILAHALGAREPDAARELPRPLAEDEDGDDTGIAGRVVPFAPPRVVASTPAPAPAAAPVAAKPALPEEPSGRIEPTLGPLPTPPVAVTEPPPAPVVEPPAPKPEAPAEVAVSTPAAPEPASSVVIRRPSEAAVAPPRAAPVAYNLPPTTVLATAPASDVAFDEAQLAQNAKALEVILKNFGVRGEIMEVRPGPVVTLYELEPAPGTKSARIINLADDIARSMSAVAVRIAVVPGRSVIGIELPNPKRETVYLSQMLGSAAYQDDAHRLPLTLGKDIGGEPVVADLARMPHLLIAGTTGSGKSVGINTMILSLIYRLPPDRCRFIMIDPKMLELSVYDGIPHLLTPVVTEPKKAVVALKWAVREMESRYRAMAKLGVRNIEGYNTKVVEIAQSVGATPLVAESLATGEDGEEEAAQDPTQRPLATLPYIVIVVDEMADLMLVAGKDIEAVIQRLAQMARAAGIHLIMATQRPSVDVITGTIKANFPTRISFQVTSKIDSRTILGEGGAEQLLGQGDMLYMAGGGRITRVHGPFVSDREVESVVAHLKAQGQPSYLDNITRDDEDDAPAAAPAGRGTAGPVSMDDDDMPGSSGDDLYDQAVALVLRERKASVSFIQRHLQIGYNRSARIVERMEQERILGPANHVGKREILLGRGGGGRGFDDED